MTIEASIELIGYALAKQLPDIETRAVFETNYGTLVLDNEDSRKVGALVRRLLQSRLTRLNRRKTRLQPPSEPLSSN